MSREQKHIDKLIKAKLADRNFGPPPKTFIDDLNIRLDKGAKKPFSFILFIFLTSLLFAGFLILLLFPSELKFQVKVEPSLIHKLENSSKSLKNEGKTNDLEITSSSKVHNIEMDNTLLDSKTKEDSFTSTQPLKVIQSTKTNASLPQEKSIRSINSPVNSPVEIQSDKNSTPIDSNLTNNNYSALDIKKPANTSERSKTNNIDYISNYKVISAIELPLIRKKINNPAIFNFNLQRFLSEPPRDTTLALKINKEQNSFRYELQFLGGINFDLSKINNTVSYNYAEKLNLQSKNELSPHIGLNLNILYSDFVFGSGFSFTQQREDNNFKLNTIYSTDSVFISNYVYEYTYDTMNNSFDSTLVPVYDTTQITTQQLKEFKIEQNYSWIQIPIHFGYRFQLKKWAITPSLGVNFSLGVKNKSMKYPDENFEHLNEYKPVQWHINLQGNIEVRREINQWHIFLRGGYQYGVNPVLKSDLFNRRYNSINALLGIGYVF